MGNGFVWYELMTSDPEAAKSFYSQVVGWETRSFDGSSSYWVIEADGRGIGGIFPTPAEARDAGARDAWLGYIAVPDVDAAAASITAAGGKTHRDIMDIPGVGQVAMIEDPQGAFFYLIAPDGEDQPPASPMSPGHVGWHELHTSHWEAAFDFYAGEFGWAKADALDMGPMGTYQLFTAGGEMTIGGMFNADTFGRPAWLFYFVVGDIDEAAGRVRASGGQVLQEPMEVPGGAWVIRCSDPQGAMFALVGRRAQSSKGEEA